MTHGFAKSGTMPYGPPWHLLAEEHLRGTTPTFLNMLLISDAHQRFDLSSLSLITYGTEPMPVATLRHLHEEQPRACPA